jgi:hypothetical protein
MGEWNQNGLSVDWMGGRSLDYLAQDRVRWRAVGNAVINLRVLAPRSFLYAVDKATYPKLCLNPYVISHAWRKLEKLMNLISLCEFLRRRIKAVNDILVYNSFLENDSEYFVQQFKFFCHQM